VKLNVNTIRRRGYAEASYVEYLLSLLEVDKRCYELPGDSPSEGISGGPVFRVSKEESRHGRARRSTTTFQSWMESEMKKETTLVARR
jgi:hypothetical protein